MIIPHGVSTLSILPVSTGPLYFQNWVVPFGSAPVLNKAKVFWTAILRKKDISIIPTCMAFKSSFPARNNISSKQLELFYSGGSGKCNKRVLCSERGRTFLLSLTKNRIIGNLHSTEQIQLNKSMQEPCRNLLLFVSNYLGFVSLNNNSILALLWHFNDCSSNMSVNHSIFQRRITELVRLLSQSKMVCSAPVGLVCPKNNCSNDSYHSI